MTTRMAAEGVAELRSRNAVNSCLPFAQSALVPSLRTLTLGMYIGNRGNCVFRLVPAALGGCHGSDDGTTNRTLQVMEASGGQTAVYCRFGLPVVFEVDTVSSRESVTEAADKLQLF